MLRRRIVHNSMTTPALQKFYASQKRPKLQTQRKMGIVFGHYWFKNYLFHGQSSITKGRLQSPAISFLAKMLTAVPRPCRYLVLSNETPALRGAAAVLPYVTSPHLATPFIMLRYGT